MTQLAAQRTELEQLGFRFDQVTEDTIVATATRFHWDCAFTFVSYLAVVVRVDELTADRLRADRKQYLALARKLDRNRLPRGLQKGRAVVVAYVANRTTVQVRELCEAASRRRFATFFLPAVLDLNAQQAFYDTGFWLWGGVYASKLRFLVQRLLQPALVTRLWPWSRFGLALTALIALVIGSSAVRLPSWLGWRLPVRAAAVAGTSGATALFAGPIQFCVLVADEARCWSSGPHADATVRTIQALQHPRAIAMRFSNACALDDRGVQCWTAESPRAVPIEGTAGASELIAVDEHFCALVGQQVKCFRGPAAPVDAMAGLRRPNRLLRSLTGYSFCANDDDGLKCFRYRATDNPPIYEPTFWLTGLPQVTALSSDEWAYRIVAIAQGRLLSHYEVGRGELHANKRRRRSFDGPIALKPMVGFKNPRTLVERSIHTWVLDDEGIKSVVPGGRFDEADLTLPGGGRVRSDKGGVHNGRVLAGPQGPVALWSGPGGYVFTRDEHEGIRLRCSGSRSGKPDSFVIRGVGDPKHVVHGLYEACALDGTEVRCWSVPDPGAP